MVLRRQVCCIFDVLFCQMSFGVSPKHENPKTLNSLVVLQLWGESPSLKLSTPNT